MIFDVREMTDGTPPWRDGSMCSAVAQMLERIPISSYRDIKVVIDHMGQAHPPAYIRRFVHLTRGDATIKTRISKDGTMRIHRIA